LTVIPASGGAFQFFPNPAPRRSGASFLCVCNESTVPGSSAAGTYRVSFELYNLAGERVLALTNDFPAGAHLVPVDTAPLSSGLYYFRVTVNGGKFASGKIALVE
jgi:hypothetical protein